MTAKGIITHTRTLVIAVSLVFTLPLVSIFGGSQAEAQMGKRDMGLRPAPSRQPSGAKTRPAARPDYKPGKPSQPAARPPAQRPPQATQPIAKPPGQRPPQATQPIVRPPGHRPPGHRPPNVRPPIARPPGWRPPHWRPPLWRPPTWHPPVYRPPYVRPPHYLWGPYFWYPRWGWYFTATVASATLVYVATLPVEQECVPAMVDGEKVYICDGVLYRPTYYRDEQVYEIVSEPDELVE
jgi:hypothetical protein